MEVKPTKVNKARPTNPSKAFDKHVGSYIRTIVTNEFPNLIKDLLFIRELNLACVRVFVAAELDRCNSSFAHSCSAFEIGSAQSTFPIYIFEFGFYGNWTIDTLFDMKKCEYKNDFIDTFRFTNQEK